MEKLKNRRIINFPKIDLSDENCKAVLIDIDGTLYDYDWSHQAALEACYQSRQWNDDDFNLWEKKYRQCRTNITQRLSPTGSCRSRLLAFQELMDQVYKKSHSLELALDLENMYWNTFLRQMCIDKNASAFLDEVKKKSLKLCAVTDMQHGWQIKKLKSLGVVSYFDYLVSSELVGIEKPGTSIFQYAQHLLELPLNTLIMVGDCPIKDIRGAQALGIKSFQVHYV